MTAVGRLSRALLAACLLLVARDAAAQRYDADAVKVVLDWLQGAGGWRHEALEARAGKWGGTALFATADIKKDEVVFSLPYTSILGASHQAYKGKNNAATFMAAELAGVPDTLLATTLWYCSTNEAGCPIAGLQSILASWPQSVEAYNMPSAWSEDELAELQSSSLAPLARQQHRNALDRHEVFVLPLFSKQGPLRWVEPPSAAELAPFLAAVRTRGFGVHRPPSNRRETGLVPFADYANHVHSDYAAYYRSSEDNQRFELFAVRDISAGEEVTTTYGEHPKGYMLLSYGFVPQHDGHGAFLNVSVARNDPLRADKLEALQKLGLLRVSATVPITMERPPVVLMGLARIIVATKTELTMWAEADRRLSHRNERAALRRIARAAREAVESSATTLEEDEAIMEQSGDSMSNAVRSAVALRMSEKRALLRMQEHVRDMLKELREGRL